VAEALEELPRLAQALEAGSLIPYRSVPGRSQRRMPVAFGGVRGVLSGVRCTLSAWSVEGAMRARPARARDGPE
jgi:hypothetical protein